MLCRDTGVIWNLFGNFFSKICFAHARPNDCVWIFHLLLWR